MGYALLETVKMDSSLTGWGAARYRRGLTGGRLPIPCTEAPKVKPHLWVRWTCS